MWRNLITMILGTAVTGTAMAQSNESAQLEDLLSTTVVTAARYDQDVKSAPASVFIVSAADIDRNGFTTLADVLETVPGFYISYDRNYTYIGVRGFSRPTDYNNRVLVLVDGHPTNENFYGSAYAGTELAINFKEVERVEIVKGPGSSLYGTGAMFAVINVITKSGKLLDGLEVTGDAGSFGRVGVAAAFGKQLASGADVAVSALYGDVNGQNLYFREFYSLATNYGESDNQDWDKYYGFQARATVGSVTLTGLHTSRKKGVPTGAWDVLFNDPSSETLDERTFVRLSKDLVLNHRMQLNMFASYDRYHYAGTYPYEGIVSYDKNESDWVGTGLQYMWDPSPASRWIVGASYTNDFNSSYRFWDADTVYTDANHPSSNYGLYIQNELQVSSNLILTLGIRGDMYTLIDEPLIVAPRCAAVYDLAKNSTFKLLFGQANRIPNLYELTYEDPFAGYKANPALKPERITTYEVAWEQRYSPRFGTTVSFFHNRMKNLIDDAVDPTDSLYQNTNVGRVTTYGVEAGFKLINSGIGDWQGSISYQQSRNEVEGNDLTNSPHFLTKTAWTLPIRKYSFATLALRHESSRITVYDTKTSGFLLTDAHIIIDPRSFGLKSLFGFRTTRLKIGVSNLFNVSYGYPGGYEHRQAIILQDGRSASVQFECGF